MPPLCQVWLRSAKWCTRKALQNVLYTLHYFNTPGRLPGPKSINLGSDVAYSNGRFINMPNFVDFVDGVTEKKHTHRTVGLNDVSPHTMRRQKMYGHVWIKCAVWRGGCWLCCLVTTKTYLRATTLNRSTACWCCAVIHDRVNRLNLWLFLRNSFAHLGGVVTICRRMVYMRIHVVYCFLGHAVNEIGELWQRTLAADIS